MSPFHVEALHMTSKLDRQLSALVEVCKIIQVHINLLQNVCINNKKDLDLIAIVVGGSTGSSVWINGNRGATSCHVNTDGVFSHGIWLVQTI